MSTENVRVLEVVRYFSSGDSVVVGRLAQNRDGIFFQYDEPYVAAGHGLSPFNLRFDNSLSPAPVRPFGGLHGVFADSLPDGWGLRLMDRAFRRDGIDPATITAMDRLAFIGKRGMGALAYRPEKSLAADGRLSDISELGHRAETLFEGDTESILAALVEGGSSAGARPKALVFFKPGHFDHAATAPRDDYQPWLIKFTAPSLPLGHQEGLCEAAYLTMAAKAGIDVPEWRLIHAPSASKAKAWLATRRFDCVGENGRLHMHSVAGLLHADFRLPSIDYVDLIKAGQNLCQSPAVGKVMFDRAMFNLFAANQDDHAKNWAFLMDDHGEWRPTPFYDVTYSPTSHGEHQTAFLGHGKNPPKEAVQRLARQASYKTWSEARNRIQEIVEAIQLWPQIATDLDVERETKQDITARLESVLAENKALLA